jgi:hypothetical protein
MGQPGRSRSQCRLSREPADRRCRADAPGIRPTRKPRPCAVEAFGFRSATKTRRYSESAKHQALLQKVALTDGPTSLAVGRAHCALRLRRSTGAALAGVAGAVIGMERSVSSDGIALLPSLENGCDSGKQDGHERGESLTSRRGDQDCGAGSPLRNRLRLRAPAAIHWTLKEPPHAEQSRSQSCCCRTR